VAQVMLLGEELFQDDPDLFRSGVAEGWAMGAVLSPEKLGTLTDLIDYGTIFTLLKSVAPPPVSSPSGSLLIVTRFRNFAHRPRAQRLVLTSRKGAHAGEIDADVAVGMGCWGLRCCEPSHRSVDELNRLIEIDEHLRDEHVSSPPLYLSLSSSRSHPCPAGQHKRRRAHLVGKGFFLSARSPFDRFCPFLLSSPSHIALLCLISLLVSYSCQFREEEERLVAEYAERAEASARGP